MDKIEELLTRGVENIYPTKDALENVLRSGKKLKLYQGFDPTGPHLHLGHAVTLRKLRQFQDLGHHVIFLIGDFTGMIGDPTGKLSDRKILTHEQVLANAKNYKTQASSILRFDGENAVEIKYNSEWLGKTSALEFLKIANLLSVQQVVERDMFQERKKKGKDIFMNEFLYPVLQAYDSVAMNVDLELGGSDQMFNMLMGRKLMRHMLHKEKFVMTIPLLTDASGNKIGKTEGNVIALTAPPKDFYAMIMSLEDDVIVKCFEYLTDIPMQEVQDIAKKMASGENPMTFKKKLSFILTAMLNDVKSAQNAQDQFESVVQKGETPPEIPEIKIKTIHTSPIELLVQNNLITSRSAAKRIVEQGGVELDKKTITDPKLALKITNGMILKVGKRNFFKLIV